MYPLKPWRMGQEHSLTWSTRGTLCGLLSKHSRAWLVFKGKGPWQARRMKLEVPWVSSKTHMKAHIQGRLILCINTDREVTYIGQAKNVSSPCRMLAGCILGYFAKNIASGSREVIIPFCLVLLKYNQKYCVQFHTYPPLPQEISMCLCLVYIPEDSQIFLRRPK